MNRLSLLLVALAAGLVLLGAGLRPDAFYVGDPGVKLIAAQNAIAHPTHPLDVTLPTIDSISVPHLDPFFAVHGDHAHAVTSELFPLVSAPFLRLFGVQGVYVLPAVGYLLTIAGCAMLATTLDERRRPLVTALTAALATPFLFYGLEFWEHTLAVGCGAVGAALFLRRQAFSAGLLFGLAVLFRPEAAWFAASVLVASWWFVYDGPRFRDYAVAAAGALVAVAPLQIRTVLHFGTLFPPHLTANAAGLGGQAWLPGRVSLLSLWFGTSAASSFWRVAPVVVIALLSQVLGSGVRRGRTFLWIVAGATTALVLLTAPNDGGGQWGPRYLLLAYVPLAILAADAYEALGSKRAVSLVAVSTVVLASLWIQRNAYRELQGTKETYGRIIDFVATEAPPGRYVVTDVWWLDQIAASIAPTRRFLFVRDNIEGLGVVKRVSNVNVPAVTVVRSMESPDTGSWTGDSCYHEVQRDRMSLRGLVAIQLRHDCPPQ